MTREILGLPPSLVQRRDHGMEGIPAGALVLLQRAGLPFLPTAGSGRAGGRELRP
jgi:hypothetical protein